MRHVTTSSELLIVHMYQYPEHLTGEVANLPQTCGVYFFHGENGAHPLYIGKSVNIRRRVLSHLRNPREAQLLSATRRITFIETVGEVGALLLESSLVKQQSPLYNKRLRKIRRLCALQVNDTQTRIVYSDALDFSRTPDLYGLFLRRTAAVDFLLDIADRERLCLTYLDVEKGRPGHPCFRYQLGKCAGVCCGKESPQAHQTRLLAALTQAQVRHWPFPGRIAIEERQGQLKAFHVISNWFYLGTTPSLHAAEKLSLPADEFDRDCYRILCRRLFHENREHIHLIDTP